MSDKTIIIQQRQSLLDVANQEYGNIAALPEILFANDNLTEVTQQEITGISVVVNTESDFVNKRRVKALNGVVIATL